MASADFTIKQHDTRPALVRTLQQTVNGVLTPINLTAATAAAFFMRHSSASGLPTVVSGMCSFSDRSGGQLTYTWAAGDTAVEGTYLAEFQITWGDGGVETVPNDGYFTVLVLGDLG